ncbi:hypothetical protein BDFB_014158, partial [Asbolus verrucosus]
NIDDNGSNGAVTEITGIMNVFSDESRFCLGTHDGSEDVGVNDALYSILWNVMWPAL